MWTAIGVVIVSYLVVRWLLQRQWAICKSKADLAGKTVLITGANAGIGFFTALDLAKRNARVILACRSQSKAQAACDRIKSLSGNSNVVVRIVDLSSMKSVREFAAEINRSESQLDILINNAGIGMGEKGHYTEEGLHYLMASNYFGPCLLTRLLLDLLKKSESSRIVNVSSIIFKVASIDFDNLNMEKYEPSWGSYSVSKLGNVLFTRELHKRLEGTGVFVNCLHPGSVNSEFFSKFSLLPLRLILQPIAALFFRSEEMGAQSSIYCAVSDEMEGVGGQYIEDCKIVSLPAHATDAVVAKKLWEETSKYIKVEP